MSSKKLTYGLNLQLDSSVVNSYTSKTTANGFFQRITFPVRQLFVEEILRVSASGGRVSASGKGTSLCRDLKGFGPCSIFLESLLEGRVVDTYRGKFRHTIQRIMHT